MVLKTVNHQQEEQSNQLVDGAASTPVDQLLMVVILAQLVHGCENTIVSSLVVTSWLVVVMTVEQRAHGAVDI